MYSKKEVAKILANCRNVTELFTASEKLKFNADYSGDRDLSPVIREQANRNLRRMLLGLMLLISMAVQAQFQFNQDQDWKLSFWVDPTLTDPGAQFGVDIKKEMHGFFAMLSFSTYPELKDGYEDLVFTIGPNFTIGRNEAINLWAGFRGGFLWRDGGFPLAGGIIGFDIKVVRGLYVGPRLWLDYRADQENEHYGDVDAYEPGILVDNPYTQENGSISITWVL